jgi:hypothetical protein
MGTMKSRSVPVTPKNPRITSPGISISNGAPNCIDCIAARIAYSLASARIPWKNIPARNRNAPTAT